MQLRISNTAEPEIDMQRKYLQTEEGFPQLKPIGLWYSIGEAWHEWATECLPERICKNNFELIIDTSRMLIIQDWQNMDELHARYEIDIHGLAILKTIDWTKVIKDYAGIEFKNYYTLKAESFYREQMCTWFWSVDVPSGCIWDLSAITDYRPYKVSTKINNEQ